MKTHHFVDKKRPMIHPKFMMDDFGDEIMAVCQLTDEIDSFQIKLNPETWWHMFDLHGKILDWADGHDEE